LISGGLVYLIMRIWPVRTAYLVLAGATYYEDLTVPHNAYGWESLRGVSGWARNTGLASWWGSGKPRLSSDQPQELGAKTAWYEDLEKGFKEKTVVLFLSLHGASDSQGAYLLLDDPQEHSRVPLEEVLDRLGRLPEKTSKVLILDATQVTADWALGMLHNDFVRKLKDLDKRIEEIPNLIVLSASDEGERSWVSEEWRQTIFGHYVLEGLKGAADADGNRRVTALELFQYVSRNVQRWVKDNRDEPQRPLLLPEQRGEQRARGMDLVVIKENYTAADPGNAPGVNFEVPSKDLEALWERSDQLSKRVPPPEVYSPHLWRLYRNTLLRYEDLLRACTPDEEPAVDDRLRGALANLKQELSRLEGKITQAQALELKKETELNALPLPRAVGLPDPPGAKDLATKFQDLWAAPPGPKREEQWAAVRKWLEAQGAGRERLLRLQLAAELLKKVEEPADNEDPERNLASAAALLKLLTGSGNDRPVEAHFLAIWVRDRPADKARRPGVKPYIQEAVRLHRLAEQAALAVAGADGPAGARAHPYSESICPWIRGLVAQGDDERCRGEDLLMATEPEQWDKAREHFEKAQKLYGQAGRNAAAVRQALQTRDQVLADLPYYSRWLARRVTRDAGRADEVKTLFKVTEGLWENTHRLAALLDQPPPSQPNALQRRLEELKPLTAEVRQAFHDKLEDRFRTHCKAIREEQTQPNWQDIQAALTAPLIEHALRRNILQISRDTSRDLNLKKLSPDEAPAKAERELTAAQESASRQGRMALAVLGQRVFDRLKDQADRASYQQVEGSLADFPAAEKWWVPLARAGDQIGYRWKALGGQVTQQVTDSLKAGLPGAGPPLAQAAALCRQIDDPAVRQWDRNPVDQYRRLEVHDLLGWEARRAYRDHWFAENRNLPPYYQVALERYLGEAEALVADPPAEATPSQRQRWLASVTQETGKTRAELKPTQLHLEAVEKIVRVTSEGQFPVSYQLRADPGLPPGFAVLWLDPVTKPFKLDRSAEAQWRDRRRDVLEVRADRPRVPVSYKLNPDIEPPPSPLPVEATTALEGRYRGQIVGLEAQTPLALQLRPNVIEYRDPLPRTGAIAIRADQSYRQRYAANNSGLVIILDCSGSMGAIEEGGRTRLENAVRALREVLKEVPKDTMLSLWVFGGKEIQNDEETIRTLRDLAKWDPNDEGQRSPLEKKLGALRAGGWTPLVRTMLDARRDLRQIEGRKVMLVLTDGMDTRFEPNDYTKGDPKYNPKGDKKIQSVLRDGFEGSGIEIKIVGFKLKVEGEERQAEEQFKGPINQLHPRGEFYSADNPEELTRRLREALKAELMCQLQRVSGAPVPGFPADGVEVPEAEGVTSYKWLKRDLGPGLYKLFAGAPKGQVVDIDKGDLLMIALTGKGVERTIWARYRENAQRPQTETPGKDWLLAALQNQLKDDGSQQLLVTLEQAANVRAPTLKHIKPNFIWFEVKAQEVAEPVALNWERSPGYFAPAWALNVPKWPSRPDGEPARPVLRSWWLSDQEPPSLETLKRDDLTKVDRKEVSGDGGTITVESFGVEKLKLRDGNPTDCLVVRLRHPPGKPALAVVEGLDTSGLEHRFYSEANRYTGIFWPVTKGQLEQTNFSVKLISVEACKKEASRKNTQVELTLEAPQPGNSPPPPALQFPPPEPSGRPMTRWRGRGARPASVAS
jgi:hypothetical protein